MSSPSQLRPGWEWILPQCLLDFNATPQQEFAVQKRVEQQFRPRNFLDWLHLPGFVRDVATTNWNDILFETTSDDPYGYSIIYVH